MALHFLLIQEATSGLRDFLPGMLHELEPVLPGEWSRGTAPELFYLFIASTRQEECNKELLDEAGVASAQRTAGAQSKVSTGASRSQTLPPASSTRITR